MQNGKVWFGTTLSVSQNSAPQNKCLDIAQAFRKGSYDATTMKIPTKAALLKQSEKGTIKWNLQNNNNKNVLFSGAVDSDLH